MTPAIIGRLDGLWQDLRTALTLPHISVNLMHDRSAGNDPFYGRITATIHREYTRRHPRFPLIQFLEYGVALCRLPGDHESWWMALEGSARRNVRKAQRLGYSFERIDYNAHLADITAIHRSTTVRQGAMDEAFLQRETQPIDDPPSRDRLHDYPYFGVLKDGKVVAYAGCLVAGEIMMIHAIYGHAAHHGDGVVPLLISGVAERALLDYPEVRYLAYDKWFGASPTLRRFKRKFNFAPHRVEWVLS